jgi:hypothetical protein
MKNSFSLRQMPGLLFGLLLLLGCQKELAEEDLIYRGDWDSPTYALQIYSNGYGVCNSKRFGGLTCEGYVRIRESKIVFTSNKESSTLARKAFRINESPAIDPNGVKYMVLDGERFTRR